MTDWMMEHPWVTFFAILAALSAVKVVIRGWPRHGEE